MPYCACVQTTMNGSIGDPEICTVTQAESYLNLYYSNFAACMEKLVEGLLAQKENWTDFDHIEHDIKIRLNGLHQNRTGHIQIAWDCLFFNKVHGFLMPLIYQTNEQEDLFYFDKSQELCNVNVTAEQLGAPEKFAVPLIAAVVELSCLDNHISPLEKLNCLSSTYDLIFAELKSALIDVISKFSNVESQIPVINNSEIIPILVTVIIRSKLLHLFSNIYYIETFLGYLLEETNARYILRTFKQAIEMLRITTLDSLQPGCEKVCREMDLIKLINISDPVNARLQSREVVTPLDGQLLRITSLIVTSTNENHFVE